jgi:hypothetical protein
LSNNAHFIMAMDFLNESLNSMISIKDYGIHGVHVPLGIKFLNPIILTNFFLNLHFVLQIIKTLGYINATIRNKCKVKIF